MYPLSLPSLSRYDPSPQWDYRAHIYVDGERSLLYVQDTAGQEEYSAMRDKTTSRCHGFVCTYSITSRSSFEEITAFRDQILWIKDEDKVPMILVGNKCDLAEERQVRYEEGLKLAESFSCPFFETSAKNCINVDEAFDEIVREVRKDIQEKNTPWEKRRTHPPRSRCSIF
jgi:GTPase KRas